MTIWELLEDLDGNGLDIVSHVELLEYFVSFDIDPEQDIEILGE